MSEDILLGQQAQYKDEYNPDLLHPIHRAEAREKLLLSGSLPFSGTDYWTAYELSWLNRRGKPVCAMAEFSVPADSPAIIESKSFKYYLNSFNQTQFVNAEHVRQTLAHDLSAAAGANIGVKLRGPDDPFHMQNLPGSCVDSYELENPVYLPDASLLAVRREQKAKEMLYSHLLKSNCPVTGQPDWATIWISYRGPKIIESGLLAYIVSFRKHQDFHENCVERIFMDILRECAPDELSVYARYTRRGGLDINPFRTNCGAIAPELRVPRQ